MAGSDAESLRACLRESAGDLAALLSREDAIHTHARALVFDGTHLANDALIVKWRADLDGVVRAIGDRALATRLMLLAAALEGANGGRNAALTYLIDALCDPDLQKLVPVDIYHRLARHDWFAGLDAATLAQIVRAHAPRLQTAENIAVWKIARIQWALGMGTSADMVWLRIVLDAVSIPWMLQGLERGYDDLALVVENDLYGGWLRRSELVEHFVSTLASWEPQMLAAGKRRRAALGEPAPIALGEPAPIHASVPHPRKRIGIFIHAASWLAHIALLHRTLSVLPIPRAYDICVYALTRRDETMTARMAEIGVDCVFMADTYRGEDWSMLARYTQLRERMIADGVDTAIWLCQPMGMSYAFGMGLAPKQVYWSMKTMNRALTAADDYWMSFNGPGDVFEFQGKPWKLVPVTFDPAPAPDEKTIADIRARFGPDAVLMGTLAREDKLNQPDFLNTVCDALDRNPTAHYLYTGREDLPAIRGTFRARGHDARAHFIGWVDTALYARVFDIYLDCWPGRSGVTLFNALEAETPMLFYMGDHTNDDTVRLSFFFHILSERDDGCHLDDPALDAAFDLPGGERALLACRDKNEYAATLDRLIADARWRKTVGGAGRALYADLTDTRKTRRVIESLLAEALNATA
ncbi:MAG: hypothetical protein H6865_04270 [Rhodospirillales bacterium]|nr:hypothetical protein [Alphaproteobacteria bacterium]MCB9986833.1 hypothetical protein [Rhodospirillales bacterium]USO08403.1 MAG: hypothetical protein H6866_04110 [Rhodospirillales bacterium]